ncbi:PAS domain-containing protein [Pelagovum pacificum]|uniref:PAS domain-containing protein n=1 Tax=Pelagovum pacificum TaxID=2588711 RepID=A0A5C5GI82_9RHOB|nr:PAS domain-containing protein [Pelagovum pacificum]QQA43018.1 PAS domain-containing protein [Pelagovum pacificum]TNY33837.1 PAS domain-containing protein [Pelagovum pacificum]
MTVPVSPGDFASHSRLAAGEVPFAIEELFFSRTDGRGIIKGGNEVFQRVSGYPFEELIDAPHRIVRHPDMPKGVFHLLWARLKRNLPTGAYVKNLCKDGRHYWVYALVSPIEGGYLSIRLKPSNLLRPKIEQIYATMLEEENAGATPEQSSERLLDLLRDAGFSRYDAFQARAIGLESEARNAATDRLVDHRLQRFMAMSDAIREVETESEGMMRAFEAIRTIPLNMRILASRLESAGGPISAISVNYGSMSDEMAAWVRDFVTGDNSAFARIQGAILNGLFLHGVSQLTDEMAAIYRNEENRNDAVDPELEVATLEALKRHYAEQGAAELKQIELEAGRLSRSVLDMKRHITGLSSTRMMCKIESATLSKSGETLVGIVDQLDSSQDGIEERLARITELNHLVQANTSMLRAGMGRV